MDNALTVKNGFISGKSESPEDSRSLSNAENAKFQLLKNSVETKLDALNAQVDQTMSSVRGVEKQALNLTGMAKQALGIPGSDNTKELTNSINQLQANVGQLTNQLSELDSSLSTTFESIQSPSPELQAEINQYIAQTKESINGIKARLGPAGNRLITNLGRVVKAKKLIDDGKKIRLAVRFLASGGWIPIVILLAIIIFGIILAVAVKKANENSAGAIDTYCNVVGKDQCLNTVKDKLGERFQAAN